MEIKIGDKVEISGDTQSYILTDPDEVYTGEVIGKDNGELLVRLDKPVTRGPGKFHEVSVPEKSARRAHAATK
jgi:hypothetical protein